MCNVTDVLAPQHAAIHKATTEHAAKRAAVQAVRAECAAYDKRLAIAIEEHRDSLVAVWAAQDALKEKANDLHFN